MLLGVPPPDLCLVEPLWLLIASSAAAGRAMTIPIPGFGECSLIIGALHAVPAPGRPEERGLSYGPDLQGGSGGARWEDEEDADEGMPGFSAISCEGDFSSTCEINSWTSGVGKPVEGVHPP